MGHSTENTSKLLKRFEPTELVLHWANAVPFVTLLCTGGLIIAYRFLHYDASLFNLLRVVHKTTGIIWPLALASSFIFFGPRLNFGNLRQIFSLGVQDIKWMIVAFRSLYHPELQPPPAAKFNTGQKINSILVVVYAVLFPASGLVMWFYGTVLISWYFHAALFFMAATSVGGHLYLSFLNPSTRVGLGGIFHGWVPDYYIIHHHSLTLAPAEQQEFQKDSHALGGSFMKMEIIILILTFVLGFAGLKIFNAARRASLARGFDALIAPNDLSKAHQIKEIDKCDKCHALTGEIKDENCLKCHKIIQQRKEGAIGYHGKNKGPCRKCHKEHPGVVGKIIKLDQEKFDHNLADFKLEGKHREVKCDKCHRRWSTGEDHGFYIGIKHDACTDCHKDPHRSELGDKCNTCHTVAGWKGRELRFDHDRDSKFRLEGKHRNLKCVECHHPRPKDAALATALFKNLRYDQCADCHKVSHKAEIPDDKCKTCHNMISWKGKDLLFDHDRDSKFKLEGKHKTVKCVECHQPRPKGAALATALFKNLKHDLCKDCHKDPHKSELGDKCKSCHTMNAWKGKDLVFDHERDSKFHLEGKHKTVKCVECHQPRPKGAALSTAEFKNLKHDLCKDCHKDPHKSELGDKCKSCHTMNGWKGKDLIFDHDRDSKYKLEGKHKTVKCVECHQPRPKDAALSTAEFKNLKHDNCKDCHKDPHKGALGSSCTYCHNYLTWEKKKS